MSDWRCCGRAGVAAAPHLTDAYDIAILLLPVPVKNETAKRPTGFRLNGNPVFLSNQCVNAAVLLSGATLTCSEVEAIESLVAATAMVEALTQT